MTTITLAPARRAEIIGNCLVCDAIIFDDGPAPNCPNGCVSIGRD